jgi:hypothetical protein
MYLKNSNEENQTNFGYTGINNPTTGNITLNTTTVLVANSSDLTFNIYLDMNIESEYPVAINNQQPSGYTLTRIG